eukprot:6212780-Pleurochrysis_carterae.AAC.6
MRMKGADAFPVDSNVPEEENKSGMCKPKRRLLESDTHLSGCHAHAGLSRDRVKESTGMGLGDGNKACGLPNRGGSGVGQGCKVARESGGQPC